MTDVNYLSADPLARAEALFRALAAPRLAVLEAAAARLHAGTNPDAAMDEIAATVHKIGGTAATLGFSAMGQSAERVERLIATGAAPDVVLAQLAPLLDTLAGLAED